MTLPELLLRDLRVLKSSPEHMSKQPVPTPIPLSAPLRRPTLQATVRHGSHAVTIGGDSPVRLQSMTNTDTADVIATAIQVKELAQAGSELVRITVNTPEAARAVPATRMGRTDLRRLTGQRRLPAADWRLEAPGGGADGADPCDEDNG